MASGNEERYPHQGRHLEVINVSDCPLEIIFCLEEGSAVPLELTFLHRQCEAGAQLLDGFKANVLIVTRKHPGPQPGTTHRPGLTVDVTAPRAVIHLGVLYRMHLALKSTERLHGPLSENLVERVPGYPGRTVFDLLGHCEHRMRVLFQRVNSLGVHLSA